MSAHVLRYRAAASDRRGRQGRRSEKGGQPLEDADLQIAATAIYHDLEIVTGNLKHFERIPGVRINRVLADARAALG